MGDPTTMTRRTETPTSTQFSFTIVDPKDDKLRKVIKTDFKVDEPCPHGDKESNKGKKDNEDNRDKDDRGTQARTSPIPLPRMNNDHPDQRTNEDQLTLGIIISASAFVLITVVVVVVCLVCSKKKNQKRRSKKVKQT